jgi:ABC-type antimicrobial peptide transport system, ATPase component
MLKTRARDGVQKTDVLNETARGETIVSIRNLRKVYKLGRERVVALDNIDLEIKRGEICCIFGTSGSGKSTLLNMMAGLEPPTRGSVVIDGVPITKTPERKLAKFRQKSMGFVFQSYNLLNSLTALENVALPLTFKGVSRRKREKMARRMLADVGLKGHMRHKPSQMSGGQQQRVGIARAFVAHPRVVFADEPTGNLDSKTTVEIMELITSIASQFGLTLIIVTHDGEIAEYADRIIRLIDGNIVSDEYNPNPKRTSASVLSDEPVNENNGKDIPKNEVSDKK